MPRSRLSLHARVLTALTVVPLSLAVAWPASAAIEAEGFTPGPEVFAYVGEVAFLTPSTSPLVVGFHEANGPGTLTFSPASGQVLDPRGRGTDPASAVDIVLPAGEDVRAVVSGTVTDVASYTLYGSTSDVLVMIEPDGRPDLRVKLLHLDEVVVVPGQRVAAGIDVIAGTARTLPFASQVDRITGDRIPHVHIEVVPAA